MPTVRGVDRAVLFGLVVVATILAQPNPAPVPTWQDEINKKCLPYRQLTVSDVPINDSVHKDTRFRLQTFIHWHYRFLAKASPGGIVYLYVTNWLVFSGIDMNDTSRRNSAGSMKDDLPYAQAILDLNELAGRQLAAFAPGELAGAQGDTYETAQASLDSHIKQFCSEHLKPFNDERESLIKATNRGQNKKKVRELGSAIRKRLDALPAAPSPTPAPVASPMPSPKAAL